MDRERKTLAGPGELGTAKKELSKLPDGFTPGQLWVDFKSFTLASG
jgi:hypothetical protein